MTTKKWPPPGIEVVEGDYALTETWRIHLPEPLARRVEEGSLVLWRPGLSVWMDAWGNDGRESRAERLAWIKKEASPARFGEREVDAGGLTRYSYRLHDENEDGPVESLNAVVLDDEGHLQLAVYFEDPAAEAMANRLVESVRVGR